MFHVKHSGSTSFFIWLQFPPGVLLSQKCFCNSCFTVCLYEMYLRSYFIGFVSELCVFCSCCFNYLRLLYKLTVVFFGCLSFLRCRVEVVFLSLRHISAYIYLLWFSLFLFMSTLFHVKHFFYRHFDVLGSTAQ